MSIALPKGLPASESLRQEGLHSVDAGSAWPGVDRPLKLALLNLMPEKTKTELQIARLLGATDRHVELILVVPDSYRPKTTPQEHLDRFYRRFSDVRDQSFDGLIVTGAPVEHLPFEAVDYWDELCEIFDWAQHHVARSFFICWAAQAALHHFHRVPKHGLSAKCFGVFRHRVARRTARLLAGISDQFWVPVSRNSEVRVSDLSKCPGLEVLVHGEQGGPCLVEDWSIRAHYMFNHIEYDTDTLKQEYLRDQSTGRITDLPANYFPYDDASLPPVNFWHKSARSLFRNWLAMIEQDRAATTCDEMVLRWLAEPSRIEGATTRSEILLVSELGDGGVASHLRAISLSSGTLRGITWRPLTDGATQFKLGLDGSTGRRVQNVVRSLLGLEGVRFVAVRNPRGFGGLFRPGRTVMPGGCESAARSGDAADRYSFAA